MVPHWVGQKCFGGVRLVDSPSLSNVARLDRMAWPMIAQMHRHGIRIDVPYLLDLDSKFSVREAEIVDEIRLWTNDIYPGFSPGSPDQVANLLFERMELKPPGDPRKLKSGRYTTEDEVLASMVNLHPVIKSIQDFREITKLRSTYTGPLPLLVGADGRLRTVFKATRTTTGRLSSGDRKQGLPNLQNIPIRGDYGKLIRNAFVGSRGTKLVGGDLSQIEMRIAAHLSGDQAMQQIFIQGLDIHNRTACALFKLSIERINYLAQKNESKTLTPEEAAEWKNFKQNQRAPAKNLGFGVLYGLTAPGLRANIMAEGGPELSEEECQKYIDAWFDAYPGIRDWMEEQYRRAKAEEMVWDMFGRTRLIPEVRSVIPAKVNEGLREAGNMPIQASAQGVIKLVMGEVYNLVTYYQSQQYLVLPLLQIHDELIFEVQDDLAEDFGHEVRYVMQNAVRLDVPVDSSSDVAEKWGEMK